ncbi:hypothetical protein DPMN_107560 [Dreissena polymorpha]|uniref:Uncharacterized protein n=1 Tax=Dreissena polymorpha TaxID=45954 RepID=A0A9D4QL23_DREPO|nr:hypothetical protein DPMN_107560 [Dreissena polymorpha]
MRSNGVSPRQKKTIRRKLLFLNVLQNEIKRKSIKVTVSTIEIVKKYWQMKSLGKLLQKDRRTLNVKPKKIILTSELKMKVQSFLEREDNSVTMPGKKDTVSKDKKQKKMLTDYLHNLHAKSCLENPGVKISRSRFSHMRPQHVLPVNFCNRNTYLCSKHQNVALNLKTIYDVAGTKNPDDFIAKYYDTQILEKLNEISKANITYTEWKKQEENGKLRWKQVQTKVMKNDFVAMITKEPVCTDENSER